MSFKHVIGKETKETKPIFDWVADGKQAVMFTIEGGRHRLRVRLHRQVLLLGRLQRDGGLLAPDPRRSRDGGRASTGSVETLQKVTNDLLAGKEVKVPVDESVKPLTERRSGRSAFQP